MIRRIYFTLKDVLKVVYPEGNFSNVYKFIQESYLDKFGDFVGYDFLDNFEDVVGNIDTSITSDDIAYTIMNQVLEKHWYSYCASQDEDEDVSEETATRFLTKMMSVFTDKAWYYVPLMVELFKHREDPITKKLLDTISSSSMHSSSANDSRQNTNSRESSNSESQSTEDIGTNVSEVNEKTTRDADNSSDVTHIDKYNDMPQYDNGGTYVDDAHLSNVRKITDERDDTIDEEGTRNVDTTTTDTKTSSNSKSASATESGSASESGSTSEEGVTSSTVENQRAAGTDMELLEQLLRNWSNIVERWSREFDILFLVEV